MKQKLSETPLGFWPKKNDDDPITEEELKIFESRINDYKNGFIRACDIRRLIVDNRRLRNEILDILDG